MNRNFGLVAELERLANALDGESSDPTRDTTKVSLQQVAERIARMMAVKPDEVAILGISVRWKHLYFITPEILRNVGFIPLSSTTALAARTARESRPEINNNFTTARHASVFEGIKVAAESPAAIQKIISAPILSEGRVVGIIQISRKATQLNQAGPDFTANDLGQVLAICKPLGKLLRHVVGAHD
jgi:GAF domain-containing protein